MPARWWVRSNVRGEPQARLYCFPMAASAAGLYGGWWSHLPAGVELNALQMPGRENRLREPPLRNLNEAVETIVATLTALPGAFDLPFSLFGYSLGGLLAFETARALERAKLPLPRRLLIAASAAPDCDRSHMPRIHALPDDQVIAELRKLQGTPEAILENAELMSLLLPMIRGDFEMLETYRYQPGPPLPIPIATFGGTADTDVRPDELAQWSSHTSSGFTIKFMVGDHFFIKTAQDQLLAEVGRSLAI